MAPLTRCSGCQAGKKVVSAYGDVYFRAWKAAQGPYLQRIEQVNEPHHITDRHRSWP